MTSINAGNTIIYAEDGREWSAVVVSVDDDALIVRTVGDNGDYTDQHALPVADVIRIAAE